MAPFGSRYPLLPPWRPNLVRVRKVHAIIHGVMLEGSELVKEAKAREEEMKRESQERSKASSRMENVEVEIVEMVEQSDGSDEGESTLQGEDVNVFVVVGAIHGRVHGSESEHHEARLDGIDAAGSLQAPPGKKRKRSGSVDESLILSSRLRKRW